MVNRWFRERARSSVEDCRVCVLLVIWRLDHFTLKKESRNSRRTKNHPAEEERARPLVGKESFVACYCLRQQWLRALRIPPVCKGPPAIRAQGLYHQNKGRRTFYLDDEVTRNERESYHCLLKESRIINGPGRQRQERSAST